MEQFLSPHDVVGGDSALPDREDQCCCLGMVSVATLLESEPKARAGEPHDFFP